MRGGGRGWPMRSSSRSHTHTQRAHPARPLNQSRTGTGKLALELVRELLDALNLKHTMAVFLPEANILKPSSAASSSSSRRTVRCVGQSFAIQGVRSRDLLDDRARMSSLRHFLSPNTKQNPEEQEREGKEERRAALREALALAPPNGSLSSDDTPLLVEVCLFGEEQEKRSWLLMRRSLAYYAFRRRVGSPSPQSNPPIPLSTKPSCSSWRESGRAMARPRRGAQGNRRSAGTRRCTSEYVNVHVCT